MSARKVERRLDAGVLVTGQQAIEQEARLERQPAARDAGAASQSERLRHHQVRCDAGDRTPLDSGFPGAPQVERLQRP